MKTLLLDCNYLGYRAKYTTGNLAVENKRTGVIYGFLLQLMELIERFETNDVIFCWDTKESKRKEVYPGYKDRNNDLTEEEKEERRLTMEQFAVLRFDILPAIGFANVFAKDGYEADDLMAIISMYYEKDFMMVTADEDMYQILDFTDMYQPQKDKIITWDTFKEEWGIVPEQWAEVKTIAGCKSDAVIGVNGVGEKTAVKYLLGKMNQKTVTYKKIKQAEEDGLFEINRPLVTLPYEGLEIEDCLLKKDSFDYPAFVSICQEYFFQSLLTGKTGRKWKNFLLEKTCYQD